MKKIEAIIRPFKLHEVRAALEEVRVNVEGATIGLAAEQRGDLRPRAFDRRARYGAVPVGARRVAECTLQIRTHRVEDLRRDRCRGVVIEVDPLRPG